MSTSPRDTCMSLVPNVHDAAVAVAVADEGYEVAP